MLFQIIAHDRERIGALERRIEELVSLKSQDEIGSVGCGTTDWDV